MLLSEYINKLQQLLTTEGDLRVTRAHINGRVVNAADPCVRVMYKQDNLYSMPIYFEKYHIESAMGGEKVIQL